MKKHSNIPIFIPEKACPHRCVFCNQKHISGQLQMPTEDEIITTVETHLSTLPPDTEIQIAFFGGNFTGIAVEEQQYFLELVQPYIAEKKVQSIRVSTRPDYIDEERLRLLKEYNVSAVELGAQSFDNEVLQRSHRGHTEQDIINAAQLINEYGFELGLQMMIGLPGDSFAKARYTAQKIVECKAKTTRIYPTLVIADTNLAALYRKGEYTPLTLDEAVAWTKELLHIFIRNNVYVLRVGLHQSEELDKGGKYIAGPYDQSLKEQVLTEYWYDLFMKKLPREKGKLNIAVPPRAINYAIGYGSRNKQKLKELYGWIKIKPDASLKDEEISYCYNR